MVKKYILFFENYEGASGETYIKNTKYKVSDIRNNHIYFGKDKISEALNNKLYTIGDILTNIYLEKNHE